MEKRAVIIGGGLGGLFTGTILAKEGLKVSVIEKNAVVGGGLQSFVRFGKTFDTGMHIIGGMQTGGSIRRLCAYLGVLDKAQIMDVDSEITDDVYFAEDRRHYRIAQGKEPFVEALAAYFPHQRQHLAAYVAAMYKISEEVDLFYLRPSDTFKMVYSEDFLMPADGFIAKYITDEKLRCVLAYMNPFYSGRANMTPAYIHALISVLYINGPSRFAGGSQRFADTLRDTIIENGGEIIVGDGVVHISSQDKRITGVTTGKGRLFEADYYISAIHPATFLTLLDDPTVLPKAYRNRLDSIPNTYSAFSLILGLKPNTFPYINHSGYYMSRYDEIWNFDRNDNWPLGFLYMTPPEIDQGPYADKMTIMAPMTWDYVKPWEHTSLRRRGKDYAAWKRDCAEKLLDRMEEIYPEFRQNIMASETASPLTIRDYYSVKEGAMCGYAKDCHNIALSQVPVVTKVDNLLFTGQNCNIHGFCGVPLSAINTSEAILGRNYVLNKIKLSERDR